MRVGVGVEAGSALVPPSGSVSELSPSAPCWQTRTPTTPITTRTATTATTHPRRLTIHRRGIIRPREAVGAPITDTITLVEGRSAGSLAPETSAAPDGSRSTQIIRFQQQPLTARA